MASGAFEQAPLQITTNDPAFELYLQQRLAGVTMLIGQWESPFVSCDELDFPADPLIETARHSLASGITSDPKSIALHIPVRPPGRWGGGWTPDMWAPFLEALAIPISLILAGGGAKNLIDLIKMWVEAKNGRTVKLKRGDIEIEIRGDVPRSEVVRAEKLLRHLEKARESKTKRANSQSGPAGKK